MTAAPENMPTVLVESGYGYLSAHTNSRTGMFSGVFLQAEDRLSSFPPH